MSRNPLIKEKERAILARQVLENPVYTDAIDVIKTSLMDTWQTTNMNQTLERENIYKMLLAVKSIDFHIQSVMKTGQLAEMQMEKFNG
jgi:hypothetical protein|tara:strand:+ start:230 stop:493 length:264 start_codon:yes stop_codon:yes gene_type:complete